MGALLVFLGVYFSTVGIGIWPVLEVVGSSISFKASFYSIKEEVYVGAKAEIVDLLHL